MTFTEKIENYIRNQLPHIADNAEGRYISEMSGIELEKVSDFLEAREHFSNLAREITGSQEITAAEVRMIMRRTSAAETEVRTMYYYWKLFRIDNELTSNVYFAKIYPTLESYLSATDSGRDIA